MQTATLLSIIGNGANKLSEIASRAGKSANEITEPLKKLRDLGYVRREIPFDESERNSKKGLYFVEDNLFKFFYRFVAPYASILELGTIDAVMNVVDSQMSSFVGECWESLCRRFVGGNVIDGVLYDKASRWWGKVFTDDCSEGEMVELDVVAESFDKKHILIGECKCDSIPNIPVTPVPVAPSPTIDAYNPPAAPPKAAPIKGFIYLKFIPNIAGSVIPNIALNAAGNANDFNFLFLVFTPTASVAPPCAIFAVDAIGNQYVYP